MSSLQGSVPGLWSNAQSWQTSARPACPGSSRWFLFLFLFFQSRTPLPWRSCGRFKEGYWTEPIYDSLSCSKIGGSQREPSGLCNLLYSVVIPRGTPPSTNHWWEPLERQALNKTLKREKQGGKVGEGKGAGERDQETPTSNDIGTKKA